MNASMGLSSNETLKVFIKSDVQSRTRLFGAQVHSFFQKNFCVIWFQLGLGINSFPF